MRLPPPLRFVLVLAFLAGCAASAFAHDPYEISADARLRGDRLELVLTMARSTASLAAARDETERRRFEPEEFAQVRPRLEVAAKEFYLLRAGEKPLELRAVDLALTVENDVEFRLTFAAPPAGPLDFFARIFARLPAEPYGSTLIVLSAKGEQLGFKFINGDDPALRVVVPAAAPPPASPAKP